MNARYESKYAKDVDIAYKFIRTLETMKIVIVDDVIWTTPLRFIVEAIKK